ncbi:hypothetical protein ccbrp13_20530 [Ktedonobacteria bacterium brp13]|nr:hypothetical protein ccbrp13_20530 [Ktedonobacteria bacterium brp13]
MDELKHLLSLSDTVEGQLRQSVHALRRYYLTHDGEAGEAHALCSCAPIGVHIPWMKILSDHLWNCSANVVIARKQKSIIADFTIN